MFKIPNLRLILMFLSLSILSVGCNQSGCSITDAPRNGRPYTKPLTVTVTNSVPEDDCDCKKAQVYTITNPNSSTIRTNLVRYSRDTTQPSSTVQSSPVRISIRKNESIKLEFCSIEVSNDGTCNRTSFVEVEGKVYPKDTTIISKRAVKGIVQDNLQRLGSFNDMNSSSICVNKCENNSADCIKTTITHQREIQNARKIRDMLGSKNPSDDIILIDDIIALIKGQKNDCSRTDMVFSNNQIFNYGANCNAKGKIGGFKDNRNKNIGLDDMLITVPSNLRGRYSNDASRNFDLTFYESKAAPKVDFTLNGVQKNYYGHRIDYINNKFYMRLGDKSDVNGLCLEVTIP